MDDFVSREETLYRIIDSDGNVVDHGLAYECAMLWIDAAGMKGKYRMEEEG